MKIAVVGTTGSGKSTLASQLGNELDLPWIELDSLFHLPNWEEESTERFRVKLSSAMDMGIASRGGWIVDGNYTSKVGDLVVSQADVVFYFNLPRAVVLYRVLKRSLMRSLRKQELWHGNRESFRNLFSVKPERNVVLWSFRTHKRRRVQLLAQAQSAPSNQLWIEITSRKQVNEIVTHLKLIQTFEKLSKNWD